MRIGDDEQNCKALLRTLDLLTPGSHALTIPAPLKPNGPTSSHAPNPYFSPRNFKRTPTGFQAEGQTGELPEVTKGWRKDRWAR